MPINAQKNCWIDYMSYDLRKIVYRSWYLPMLKPKKQYLSAYYYIAIKLNIPVELVIAHAHIESNQNHLALGQLNEYGLWQFLPSTWKQIMDNADWKDINNQIKAYIKHASYLIQKFKLNLYEPEDQKIFLWCWNAGEGNYQKKILPVITKKYIEKFMTLYPQVEV